MGGGDEGCTRADDEAVIGKMATNEALMFKAVKKGDLATISSLVATNPGLVHSREKDGSTPLHAAAWKGELEVAKVLIDLGADVNALSENDHYGTTPLHAAAHANNRDVVRLLLDSGADASIVNHAGRTPLGETTLHNATAAAKVLREFGAG